MPPTPLSRSGKTSLMTPQLSSLVSPFQDTTDTTCNSDAEQQLGTHGKVRGCSTGTASSSRPKWPRHCEKRRPHVAHLQHMHDMTSWPWRASICRCTCSTSQIGQMEVHERSILVLVTTLRLFPGYRVILDVAACRAWHAVHAVHNDHLHHDMSLQTRHSPPPWLGMVELQAHHTISMPQCMSLMHVTEYWCAKIKLTWQLGPLAPSQDRTGRQARHCSWRPAR